MNRKEYMAKRDILLNEASVLLDANDIENCEAKQEEITALDAEFEALAKAQANMNALKGASKAMPINAVIEPDVIEIEEPTNTKAYRKSFMAYCKSGVMSKELMNTDEYSTITETAALIPATILDEVIKTMKTYGQLFNRVRKLSIKGGVSVPISTVKPTASWITEASPSDKQKLGVSGSVSFLYYGLECKIATSLLAETVSLPSFETLIKELMAEAFAKALDVAIVNGAGSTEPTGITVDARVAGGQKITLSAASFVTWDGWKKKIFAKIPLSYNDGLFIMAKGTFDGYIDGMVDANGQPIGRVTYGIDGVNALRFGGKEIMLVEDDIVASYDTASTGDVVAIHVKLTDYAINSNLQISMMRWLDHDLNQWVDKAIMIADGKMLDVGSIIIIKKGA